ncbi:MAG TPA: UvrD-helicase domain-containing protein [Gemmataceae bacterium]|nr:UvrD-helicase domain-containing protein [Gemmataceae bacterium]
MAQDAPPDLLAGLTPAQSEAVTHFEGPLLILACAGSGKTRVITRRVAYLLQQGVRPYNILAITFTNKAAAEMRQRVEALAPHSRVWVSTFHSLGARLLRQYGERLGLDRNFTIYDQQDRNRLVKAALDASNIDSVRFTPERIESAISKAKNQLLNPERYASQANDFFTQTVARVYPIYEKKLRDANAVDFDDLLLWPALALKHDAELRSDLDSRFRFVLIDEYQDTNQAQYAIARGLSVDQPNLCVVGDPDQSIYKWRGSDIRNILDFERDFPRARVITLERNYRSTKSILAVASHLIAHNRQRKPKDLVTENPVGQPVQLLMFETGQDEAEGIAGRIRDAVAGGKRHYRDCAIFVRINALSRALESAFVKNRIPYQIVKGLAFFERKENRDVLAYLRLLLNPRDDLSFSRAVNEPARGVGKVSLEHLRAYAEPRELSLLAAAAHAEQIPAIKGKAAAGLRSFVQLMDDLRQLHEAAPDDVIRQVLDRSGYRAMLANSTDSEDQERLANIEELITAAKQFAEEDSSRTLADFLENITLASDVDGWDDRQDSVSIMTLHSAKGLEFPVVFMAATEQGLLPHERSLAKEEDVEEERRLAFVGITRAKEELYLCHARLREFRGQTLYAVPSMFLDELPAEGTASTDLSARSYGSPHAIEQWRTGSKAAEQGWADAGVLPRTRAELLEPKTGGAPAAFAEGMIVRHDNYGQGRVTEVSGYGALRKIKVRFSAAGERTFLADKAKLMVVQKS